MMGEIIDYAIINLIEGVQFGPVFTFSKLFGLHWMAHVNYPLI